MHLNPNNNPSLNLAYTHLSSRLLHLYQSLPAGFATGQESLVLLKNFLEHPELVYCLQYGGVLSRDCLEVLNMHTYQMISRFDTEKTRDIQCNVVLFFSLLVKDCQYADLLAHGLINECYLHIKMQDKQQFESAYSYFSSFMNQNAKKQELYHLRCFLESLPSSFENEMSAVFARKLKM